MSLTTRVLIGLIAGFTLGLALAGSASPAAASVVAALVPVGTIFVNLIRMTVIPLVVSMLIASVGSTAASGTLGRIGARAAAVAVALLVVAAIVTVVVAAPVLSRIEIDQQAAMALKGSSTASAKPSEGASLQTPSRWFIDLVPQNVIKAAVDGSMLPPIVFAVLFGLALSRVPEPRRDAALRATHGVAEAMRCSGS